MKFFTESDAAHIRNVVDSAVKNKWNWGWLQQSVDLPLERNGTKTVKLEAIFKKADVSGKAWCTSCESDINYASRGRIALVDHVKSKSHLKKTDTVLSHQSIKTMFAAESVTTDASVRAEPSIRDLVKLPVPLFDRVSNAEVCKSKICCFIFSLCVSNLCEIFFLSQFIKYEFVNLAEYEKKYESRGNIVTQVLS